METSKPLLVLQVFPTTKGSLNLLQVNGKVRTQQHGWITNVNNGATGPRWLHVLLDRTVPTDGAVQRSEQQPLINTTPVVHVPTPRQNPDFLSMKKLRQAYRTVRLQPQ
jgi:hypothetical protein